MKFKITLEYEGTKFSGWQLQKGVPTVQGKLIDAAKAVFGVQTLEVYGAGRTDSGVHALAQVAHIALAAQSHVPAQLVYRLNDNLPAEINVLTAEKVSDNFHARHDAIARGYLYLIATRRTALHKRCVWWIKDPLDVVAMQAAAQAFVGLHDFRSFTDEGEKSTRCKIEKVDIATHGNLLAVHIIGSHFLWKMVRRMVGVLVEVGRGRLHPKDIQTLLKIPSTRPAELTAPPSGLFLERVCYQPEELTLPYRLPIRL